MTANTLKVDESMKKSLSFSLFIIVLSLSSMSSYSNYGEPNSSSLRNHVSYVLIRDRIDISKVLDPAVLSENEIVAEVLIKILVAFKFSDGAEAFGIGTMILEAWIKYPELMVEWFEGSPETTDRFISILPAVFLNDSNGNVLFHSVLSSIKTLIQPNKTLGYNRQKFIDKFIDSLQKTIKLKAVQ